MTEYEKLSLRLMGQTLNVVTELNAMLAEVAGKALTLEQREQVTRTTAMTMEVLKQVADAVEPKR